MDASQAILSTLTSIIGSVIVTFLVLWLIERNRRPDLYFQIEKPTHEMKLEKMDKTVGGVQLLRLYVLNKKITRWLSWAYSRQDAMMCRAWIAFYDENKLLVYSREMQGRWSQTPNPQVAEFTRNDGQQFRYVTNSDELKNSIDIPSGEYAPLDLAIRFEGETECYGWNNDSHISNGINMSWILKEGQYIVRTSVKTGGRYFDGFFRLINQREFRLVEETIKIDEHLN